MGLVYTPLVCSFTIGECTCVWSPVAPNPKQYHSDNVIKETEIMTNPSNLTISEKIWSGSILSNIKIFCKFAPGFKPKHGMIIQPIVAEQDTFAWL